jgi:glycosyltransferase involved in cell wall biosynthesis
MIAGKRPRVVFVNRFFYPDESATSQLLGDLAFGLAQRDFHVQVYCSRQLYGAPDARLPAREIFRGVIVRRVWTTRFGRARLIGRSIDYLSFYGTCAVALLFGLRRGDVVIAETDPPLISIVAWAIARCRGATLVNWLQDIFPEVASELDANPLPPMLDRVLRALRDASLRGAAANVVLGRCMAEYLQRRGIPPEQVQIIPNWADAVDPAPRPSCESRLRAQCGLADQFVVGYSGNLGRAHDYATVLDAAEALRNDATIAFLFIGAGAKMEALRVAVEQRCLPNTRFLPYQPRAQLYDSLAAADAHWVSLIPALEGLIVPSKFYGVLAAGRPILFVGDLDGELAGVIRESECGFAVAQGDAAEFTRRVRALQADMPLRERMGAASRRLLQARFSTGRALADWTALLERLA